MGGHSRPGDEDADAAPRRLADVFADFIRRPVGREDAHLAPHAQLLERPGGGFHRIAVRCASHQNAHKGFLHDSGSPVAAYCGMKAVSSISSLAPAMIPPA